MNFFVFYNKSFCIYWRITFNGGQAKVSGVDADGVHLVKWYCDGEFRGDYELGNGNWAAFPLSLGDWKIEFWKDDEMVDEYHNNLEMEDIQPLCTTSNTQRYLMLMSLLDKYL